MPAKKNQTSPPRRNQRGDRWTMKNARQNGTLSDGWPPELHSMESLRKSGRLRVSDVGSRTEELPFRKSSPCTNYIRAVDAVS